MPITRWIIKLLKTFYGIHSPQIQTRVSPIFINVLENYGIYGTDYDLVTLVPQGDYTLTLIDPRYKSSSVLCSKDVPELKNFNFILAYLMTANDNCKNHYKGLSYKFIQEYTEANPYPSPTPRNEDQVKQYTLGLLEHKNDQVKKPLPKQELEEIAQEVIEVLKKFQHFGPHMPAGSPSKDDGLSRLDTYLCEKDANGQPRREKLRDRVHGKLSSKMQLTLLERMDGADLEEIWGSYERQDKVTDRRQIEHWKRAKRVQDKAKRQDVFRSEKKTFKNSFQLATDQEPASLVTDKLSPKAL